MPALPPASDFTGPVTEGQFKTATTAERDYLAGLLGTDGTQATALETLGAYAGGYVAKTSAYTATTADRGKLIDCTSGTFTVGLPAAASAGSGFSLAVRNGGAGTITVDPNGSEQVNGGTTITITSGSTVMLNCTGSEWAASWMSTPTSTFANSKANVANPTFTGTVSSGGPVLISAGSAAAPAIAFTTSSTTGFHRPAADNIGWDFAGVEVYRMNGNVFRMGSPATNISGINGARVEVSGSTQLGGSIGQFVAVNTTAGPTHVFAKSRGTNVADYSIVSAGDVLGAIHFRGADGTSNIISSAIMHSFVEGTPAPGDVRSGFRFSVGTGAATVTETFRLGTDQSVTARGNGGLGYGPGAGGPVTQLTSRTTGVTLNKPCGSITMFTAAGSATPASFTVTNSTVAATDVVLISGKSGASNTYLFEVTATAAGSFTVSFWTTGGTASDTPVINFAVIKAVTS